MGRRGFCFVRRVLVFIMLSCSALCTCLVHEAPVSCLLLIPVRFMSNLLIDKHKWARNNNNNTRHFRPENRWLLMAVFFRFIYATLSNKINKPLSMPWSWCQFNCLFIVSSSFETENRKWQNFGLVSERICFEDWTECFECKRYWMSQ